MKTFILALFPFVMFPLIAGAAKTTTKFQGATAYGGWSVNDPSCTSAYVSVYATEGKTTEKSQGKPVGTPFEYVGFSYSLDDYCTETSTSISPTQPTPKGNVDISFAKTSSRATMSADIPATKTVYSWSDWGHPIKVETLMVSVDATWSGCDISTRVKNSYTYNTPIFKYTITGTDQYAEGCDLDVTVSAGDVNIPPNTDNAYAYLFKGKNMQTTTETKR